MTDLVRAPLDSRRLHPPEPQAPRVGGTFVLYWMQICHRAHENFALNHAVEQANALGLPVLVYHGLRHDYPWANDRLHSFILESVADLQRTFAARGIQYAFHLDTRPGTPTPDVGSWMARQSAASGPGRRGAASSSPLVQLAERAALVVTDWFPTFIIPRQTKRLREKTDTPVVAVDAQLVVPVTVLDKEHATARGIRPRLMQHLDEHLHYVGDDEPSVRTPVSLPFTPTAVTEDRIPELVAQCAIDHSVPPSPIIRGGRTAALARLHWWLAHGLHRYEERNDPNVDVTSGMSPYLHFGNVSVQELLLLARDTGPAVPYAKFLDEVLTWRELSFNMAHWNPRHRTFAAVPQWAQDQFAKHEDDDRPALLPQEILEAGRTGELLWDAMQRSYVRDGWMHNYMRMLWGKTLIQWTPTAADALPLLEHFNNKYSLDGRNPNTYGGILWCMGKFDRPFYKRAIYGMVRYMSLKAAKDKFDVAQYIRRFLG
jgi:photolyase PhrII